MKAAVFNDGIRVGSVCTELFRRQLTTFNEAVHIALLEDHCMRSTQSHIGAPKAADGSSHMDLPSAEKIRSRWRKLKAGDRCFGCNAVGHCRIYCSKHPWKVVHGRTLYWEVNNF